MTLLNVFATGATSGKNGFQMQTELYGWPLPTLRRTQRWWDWDDLTLYPGQVVSPVLARSPLTLHWTGLVLNPLVFALPVWALLVLPGSLRRRSRRKRGLCEDCGYPTGTSAVCSECGLPAPQPLS